MEDCLSGFFSAEDARSARENYQETQKRLAFEEASRINEFEEILSDIRLAADRGETNLEFMPHSEQFYLQKLETDGVISEADADFSDNEVKAYFALRMLGYTVNIIRAKQAVGNSAVILPGMNPMQGGISIARCRILWG